MFVQVLNGFRLIFEYVSPAKSILYLDLTQFDWVVEILIRNAFSILSTIFKRSMSHSEPRGKAKYWKTEKKENKKIQISYAISISDIEKYIVNRILLEFSQCFCNVAAVKSQKRKKKKNKALGLSSHRGGGSCVVRIMADGVSL